MKKIILLLILLICFSGCSKKEEEQVIEPTEEVEEVKKETFDIDISFGSDTMAYATLENIKENPEEYIGKTFKMKGEYHSFYSEYTDNTYYVCVIYDFTRCCSLGMEFFMESEEDYPLEGINIILQGTIDTYDEDNDTFLYLRNASWKKC